ncbi:hypothetical protein [Candidatus Nitrososphaera evergladensis]|uniref:hypothetical protein n=1 Tax=Candidatus Nitrososphaera evergladensis TaxID=1459637 RepID=UPI0011E58CF9|nr:hypothetical protein [Candidatus Nitrososphaera evergladensis]
MYQKTATIIEKRVLALGLAGLVFLPALASQRAFADGLFQENIQGSIAGRNVELFVRINPPVLTTQTQQDAFVQLRLFEGNNQTIRYTTFVMEISKVTGSGEDVLMAPDAFHTESGLLTLKIQPQEGPVQVLATREAILDAWKADLGGTINIKGPVLLDGGLYHFRIDVIGVDSAKELLPPDQVRTFDTYLSVGDVITQDVQYQGKTYPATIISYYDKVKDFKFDANTKTYSWSMPFNWDIKRIKSATSMFVHEEVRIPKSFEGVGDAMTFDASVNGRPITGGMLSLDPFTDENNLILHFLVNKNEILRLEQQVPATAREMEFAFSPASNGSKQQTSGEIATDTGGMLVLLNWTPGQLAANRNATLDLEFYDAFSGNKVTDDVTYDLRTFGPDGSQVHSLAGQVAKDGSDSQTMMFPEDAAYRIEVDVKGVTAAGQQSLDLTRNGIARGTVVIPEFPAGAIAVVAGALGSMIMFHRLARKTLA